MFIFLNALFAFAVPGKTTYQAKIVKPDGYPLEASSVNFKFTILDPVGSCILYSETYSSVNMTSTGGLISFALGSGVKTYPASATTFEQVFSNITPSLSCDTGGPANYSPTATDIRKIVMQFHDGTGWQTLPAMSINAVPYAMYANEATKLNGLQASDFVQVSTVPTCAASEALRYTGTGFTCVAVGSSVTSSTVVTALGYTPADGVSVTTLTSNVSSVSSTVASVSSTVFSVSSTVTSLQSSVAASFAAITSSQWTTSGTNIFYNTGNIGIGTTTPVTKLDVSGGVRIGAESTTCAPALAGTLRYNASNVEYCNGTSWQAFGVSGAGLQSFNGSTSGTQSFATGTGSTAPNFNTSNGVHTLNIPLASTGSVTAGLISNADYTTFTNKITSSAASIAQVLGYVPANDAASGTYAQKANNLSDLTNVATARTNLGLGTFATASSIDLGSASATGTLAIARLPSFVGDATIAAASNTIILSNSGVTAGTYTKVTVDSKGRVTSSSSLASSDVTTALGYTPASATASTQWTTSGSAIYYNTGNVGIGTTTPSNKLTIGSSSTANWSPDLLAFDRSNVSQENGIAWKTAGVNQWTLQQDNDGTDNLRLYSAGTSTFVQTWNYTTGNVGIGNTNPGAVLEVGTNAASSSSFRFAPSGDQSSMRFTTNASANWIQSGVDFSTDSKKDLKFSSISAGTTWMTIQGSSGNVGVGITAPTAVLHLAAGTSSNASLKLTSGTLLTSPQSGTIEYDGTNFYLTDSTNTRRAIAANTNPGTYDNVSNINSSSNITLTPTGSVVVSSTTASTNSSTGALVVKGGLGVAGNINTAANLNVSGSSVIDGSLKLSSMTSGSVLFAGTGGTVTQDNANFYWDGANKRLGIGTSNPTRVLDVNGGTAQFALRLFGAGPDTAVVRFENTSASGGRAYHVGSTDLISGAGNGFSIFDATSATTRLLINPNGNVGIGTTSPGSALSIKSSTANNTTGDGFTNLRLEYAGGYNAGDMGAGVTFAQQYVAPGTDAATIRVGGIFGVKNQAAGNFGGGLTFFRQPAGAANMSEAMRIDQNGNVGVGTSAPVVRLDARISTTDNVSGSVLNSYPITNFINNSSGGGQRGLEIGAPTGGVVSPVYLKVKGTSSRFAVLNQFDSESLTILDSGNVGIGTTSPNSTLEVSGALTATKISGVIASIDNRAVSDTPETFSTAGMSLNFKNNSANSLADGGLYNGVFTFRPYGNATDWTGGPAHQLGFTINGNIYHRYGSNTTWNTWRRIIETDNAGNVGIGTTAPTTPLHVVSAGATGWNSIIKLETTAANAHPLIMYRHGGADTGYVGFGDGAATNGFGVYNYLNADLTLGTSSTTMMTVKPSGNVGIGTSAPGSKLSVAGTIESTSGGVKFPDASTQATSAFGPIFASYASTASSTSSTTWVKIPFNAVEFDPDSSVDTTNYRIKPTKAGYYRISMALYLTQTGTGGLTNYLSLYKNGAAIKNTVLLVNYNAGYSQSLQVDATVYLNGTTDYLEGWWTTNSSNAATLQTGVANTYISGNYIRP